MIKTLWTVIVLTVLSVFTQAYGQDCVILETTGGRLERCNEICIDFKVSNFKNVVSLQFSINWNPRVMRLVRLFQSSSPLPAFTISNNILSLNGGGVIRSSWADPNDNANTLADGTVLFTMCFIATGLPGDMTNVEVGNFPLEVEMLNDQDEELCYRTKSVPITIVPASTLCLNATACGTDGNSANGSITAFVDGGKPDYTITINPTGASQTVSTNSGTVTFSNLAPGTYTITATDANGNTETKTITVGSSPIKIIPVRLIKPKCKGQTGSILIAIEGGAGDSTEFGIHWMPGDVYGSKYYSRLQPGKYTVTVIDSLGCEASMEFDLSDQLFTTSLDILDSSSCTNSLDGIAQAKATGGKFFPGGTYKYYWSQNGDDANCDNVPCVSSINDSVSGKNQWVIIQDANNCTDTIYFDVPSHNELLIESLVVEDSRCSDDSTGSVVVTAVSNNSTKNQFTYDLTKSPAEPITGGIVTNNKYEKYNLAPGKYFISVSDTNGCTFVDTFDIGAPPPMALTVIDADTITSCTGGFDGYIEVLGAGGNGKPYHYQWSNNKITPKIDSLAPGDYSVTITDDKGCSIQRRFHVEGPTPPEITGFDVKNATCTGLSDGEVTVLYKEGTGKVTSFNWSSGHTTEVVKMLQAGSYVVTITDDNGCMDIDTVEIQEPAKALTLDSFRLEHPSCPEETNGLIALTVSGGTPKYSFNWSNGATTQLLIGIPAGTYTVTISDNGNCPDVVKTLTLVDPPHNQLAFLDSVIVSCNDGKTCDGKFKVRASGGKDPSLAYNFEWSSGEVSYGVTEDSASGLCQGPQWVIVNNDNCSDTFHFVVGAPEKIRLTPQTTLVPPSCYGYSDGSIQLDIRGGVQPYRVLWQDMPVTGFNRPNLKKGFYKFFVRDFNNCIYEDSVELTQPDSFVVSVNQTLTKSVRCNGDMDGRIVLFTQGGNPGKRSYVWSPNVSNDSIAQNIPAGTYYITSTDPKGCKDTITVRLPNPPKINYELGAITPPLCDGDKTPITVTQASGGNGPAFSFTINKGEKYDINEEVEVFPGTYTLSIFDAKGCSRDTTITIDAPRKLDIVFDPAEVELELGDSTTVCITSEVQPGDQITWTPSGKTTMNGKCIVVSETNSTTYKATIQDKNGCEAENTFSVIVINRGRIYIPNIITKDGPNSIFKVYPGKGVRSIDFMRIYDRWGELVYSRENLQPDIDGWNGGFKNGSEKMLPGVYVYIIRVTYLNGETQLFRGDVTLMY